MFGKHKKRTVTEDMENLLMTFPSNSRYAESYRTLRTNLFFSSMDKEINSVIVTSCVEKEGKTTTAINLAYTIAQTDSRTLLIDCDLRRPHMTALFSGKKEHGITGLITDTLGSRLTKGSLEEYTISDLVVLTRLQKRSCRLDITNDETKISIFFEKGVMIDIYWINRPESKKLANSLIKDKIITETQARAAIGQKKRSVQRLGTTLYTMGLVSKKEILKALSLHTIESIRAVSSMHDGSFSFSHLIDTETKASLSQEINLEKLYDDFVSYDDNFKFIKKSIDAAINKTEIENLYNLLSGIVPPNPSEMLSSKRMDFLINYFKKKFDFIIIDTPPVMPATDAVIMAPRTDGTILVMKSGHTERKIIQDVINQYKAANLRIIGSVLNQVDMKKEGYYRYYSKYYSAYYGSNTNTGV
jgi:capsular exopolysaccharide synthesis family protein